MAIGDVWSTEGLPKKYFENLTSLRSPGREEYGYQNFGQMYGSRKAPVFFTDPPGP